MDFKHNSILRIISTIVLAFFLWTFGGVFEVAYAFKNSDQQSAVSGQATKTKNQKPEEKFQKAIDEIERILSDQPSAVSIQQENKGKLKNKKSEIESLDVEIRKQFKETEEKIKELPEEIKQRHKDFVRKYEENLNILKTNLDDIEKAKTEDEVKAEVEKTKKFLEKTKPPKKHIPLDPNKLPHRTVEHGEVRLEELSASQAETLEKEFAQLENSIFEGQSAMNHEQKEPILIASIGSLAGILAQAAPQVTAPTAADLSETIEVQFTPEIKAKAQELNYNPVKIYNWVRNNIEFVPTYGSIQGANMCLQTKQCNDFDTASLLTALLRVSKIPARYVYGTIELPIEKVKNWVGGFTDSMAALNLIASGGIPVTGLTSGGKIVMVRMEHVWVEAWVDMIPSQGAVHKQGDTWVPLDASYKQYNYTQGIDIKSAVPFDAQSFVGQIKATATINETEGYVTNLNSLFIQQQMQDYQTRVQNYIAQNHRGATVGDVIGKKGIIKLDFPVLLGTLPYKRIATGAKYSSIPDSLRHKITFSVIKDIYDELIGTPINITKSLPELAGKKITLSYSPATPQDEAVINSYLPKPHPDGSPIQHSELPTSLPAYLLNLKPELKIEGVVVAIGTSIGVGAEETFTMTFIAPKQALDVVTNTIVAGEYYGITINTGRISQERLLALKAKLETTKAKLEAQNFADIARDDILGDMFYATALIYYAELDEMDFVLAKREGIVAIRLPSEAIFGMQISVKYFFGIPVSVSAGGLAMDVDRDIGIAKSLDGNRNKEIQYVRVSGTNGSALEYSVPEQLFSTPDNPVQGISAVKALKIANDQGIPIYTINQSNINAILPQLQVSGDVKTNIQNVVNAGKVVTVPKTNIAFKGWVGVGYIIIDPATGAGAYMIEGLSGGWLYSALSLFLNLLRDPATNAWIGYITGVMAKLGGIGLVLAAVINIFMISFTVTDILVNSDGTLTQKGCAVLTYIGSQALQFGLGYLAGSDAAAFVAILIINAIYIELLSAVITQKICYQ